MAAHSKAHSPPETETPPGRAGLPKAELKQQHCSYNTDLAYSRYRVSATLMVEMAT